MDDAKRITAGLMKECKSPK